MDAKPVYKTVLIKALLIAAVILAAIFFYRYNKYSFVNKKANKIITTSTDSLYRVTYDSIVLDELGGDLYIKNVRLIPDTIRQALLIKVGDTSASPVMLEVLIPELRVINFRSAKALLSKKLQCNKIELVRPKVAMYLFPGQKPPKDEAKQGQALYKQILGNLKLLQADSILVKEAEFVGMDFFTKEIKFHTFYTSVVLDDIRIDSTYNKDPSRTLYCKDIRFRTDKMVLGENNNKAEATDVMFSTKLKILYAGRLTYDGYKNGGFFKGELKRLAIKGIELKGPLDESTLKIGETELEAGSIELASDKNKGGGGNTGRGKQILTGWLKEFSLESLHIKNFSFKKKATGKPAKDFAVANSSLLLQNFAIDSSATLDGSLVKRMKELEFYNKLLVVTSEDKMYQYRFSGFKFNTRLREITLKEFAIKPALSEAAFARQAKIQTDRFEGSLKNIICSDINLERMMKGEFIINTVSTSNNYINVYRDISYPHDSSLKVGKYPHQILSNLKVPVKINSFVASSTNVEYKERNARSESSGRVRFINSNININNISNVDVKKDDKCTMNFTSRFIDRIPIKGSFTFYLNQDKFQFGGSVSKSFEGAVLNELLIPMSLMRIDKGNFKNVSFSFTGGNYNAEGKLAAEYDNLKLSFLRKDLEKNKYKKKNSMSLLANLL
ncbi:MAG: hypothetical protein JWQ96_3104, partial [Segetibacter sp.]|nr:hypothetical protein [Segetibacter sp.]